MTEEKHYTIGGKDIIISTREENDRLIIKAVDFETNDTLIAGNYDTKSPPESINRFIRNVMSYVINGRKMTFI